MSHRVVSTLASQDDTNVETGLSSTLRNRRVGHRSLRQDRLHVVRGPGGEKLSRSLVGLTCIHFAGKITQMIGGVDR